MMEIIQTLNSNEIDNLEMYSVDDIQKILGCSRKKTYQIINCPTFPKIKIGRQFFVPKSEYQKWVKRNLYKSISIF